MIITRTKEGYEATHKLPNGFVVKGTGATVRSALMWALWGVKSYWSRLRA